MEDLPHEVRSDLADEKQDGQNRLAESSARIKRALAYAAAGPARRCRAILPAPATLRSQSGTGAEAGVSRLTLAEHGFSASCDAVAESKIYLNIKHCLSLLRRGPLHSERSALS